ncbi:hypothetical protein [Paramicrobacterium agarici]|uniref:PH (Pleckstrin Homology) domain-containing protein n=1 Tax=Paramicrobacterium agarici TaxID=630514 RepID=A0A2A9DRX3_9MICO|nr:hypothetical protein [Microbacterium agarici]PFG29141.1 hypothetical protein ATJ78_0037 [Microbacterium agarici]
MTHLLHNTWRGIRFAVLYELRIYQSLFFWLIRRQPTRTPTSIPFAYVASVMPALIGFIVASAIEVPVAHLLLTPWPPVQIGFLIVGIWGLVWMFGLGAAMTVYPHTLDDAGIHIRNGFNARVDVPWSAVESVTLEQRSYEKSRHVQVHEHADTRALCLTHASQTTVTITLREPTDIGVARRTERVTHLRLHADEPRDLVRSARQWTSRVS